MAEETRTPFQQLNDYLYRQVDIISQTGSNKRMHCKKCSHNFTGNAGRVQAEIPLGHEPSPTKGLSAGATGDPAAKGVVTPTSPFEVAAVKQADKV